jgi:hypothetical protein
MTVLCASPHGIDDDPFADVPTAALPAAAAAVAPTPEPSGEVHLQPLRQGRLLRELATLGVSLTYPVNGPSPKLTLTGATARLTPALHARVAAANDDLVADLQAQRSAVAALGARIDAAEVWPDLDAIQTQIADAWGRFILSQDDVGRLTQRLIERSRVLPESWVDANIDRYLARHGGRLTMVARALAGPTSPMVKVRRRDDARPLRVTGPGAVTAAPAPAPDGEADEVQGELVGIVRRREDIPGATDGDAFVWYTTDELASLRGLTPDVLRTVHHAKKVFDGEVVTDARGPGRGPDRSRTASRTDRTPTQENDDGEDW